MPTAKITSKGQVTIPKQVRDRLAVGQGDRLVFDISPGGRITVRGEQPQPATALAGLLADYAKRRPATIEAMHAAVRKHAAARQRRSRR